jgi:hypothetical protein
MSKNFYPTLLKQSLPCQSADADQVAQILPFIRLKTEKRAPFSCSKFHRLTWLAGLDDFAKVSLGGERLPATLPQGDAKSLRGLVLAT